MEGGGLVQTILECSRCGGFGLALAASNAQQDGSGGGRAQRHAEEPDHRFVPHQELQIQV
jgi:hypothetical protein